MSSTLHVFVTLSFVLMTLTSLSSNNNSDYSVKAHDAPIYQQLPSQVAPAQQLPTVTNYQYIQQPIKQHRVIDQPIFQKRHIVQPVFLGRTIYQPIVRKVHNQSVIQPRLIYGMTITPHVTEQPVIQQQFTQQDTWVQGYQQTHGVRPTQIQPATVTVNPAQILKPTPTPTGAAAGASGGF